MKNGKIYGRGIGLVIVEAIIVSAMIMSAMSFNHWAYFGVAYAAPDVNNDDVRNAVVYQYNTTNWILAHNFTSDGESHAVHDAWSTNFEVVVKYNKTLAADSTTALAYTKCNMSITYNDGADVVWNTNTALNQSATLDTDADFYYITFMGNWTTDLAIAGEQYNCTVNYQPYY